MVMPYHLHMPSYFLETFTEYPDVCAKACLYPFSLYFFKCFSLILIEFVH